MAALDLFSSVRDGNTDIVRRLLQSKQCRARLNDRNEWGDTALHLAAEAGNGEICHMLIAAGASVTVRNNRGETCLHRAAVGGHVESVSAIVGRDQDPEAVNSQNDAGYTALHHAAKHGSRALIEILVKAGADRMLENNAGETPYMVAHKYAQWEAERLLLNVEQQHADRAIREMNRKEKDIVRAYFRAVKYASQIESRVRIMLIGDEESGKSSLKKTMFGEPYNPAERASSGIHADPSITRIKFKQYREWIQQPASKADTHRLNLEYIDTIIDYILNFLKQGRVVSDDSVDPMMLQIEKDQVKNVKFNKMESIIPASEIGEEEENESEVSGEAGDASEGGEAGEGGGASRGGGEASEGGEDGEDGDIEKDGRRSDSDGSGTGDIQSSCSEKTPSLSVTPSVPEVIHSSVGASRDQSGAASYITSLSLGDRHDPPHSPDTRRRKEMMAARSSSSSSLPVTMNGSSVTTTSKSKSGSSSLPDSINKASTAAKSKKLAQRQSASASSSPSHGITLSSSGGSINQRSRSGPKSGAASTRKKKVSIDDGDPENRDDRLSRWAAMGDVNCCDSDSEEGGVGQSSNPGSSSPRHPSPRHASGRRSPRPQLSSPNQGQLLQQQQQQENKDRREQSGQMSQQSLQQSQQQQQQQQDQQEPEFTKPETNSDSIFFSRSQRELSRLLVEKMPLEILKRMVIRWPVGNEVFRDHSDLASSRLMITVWDAAGDPLQQNFIPFFFSDRCFFVATYNLMKNLGKPCESYKNKELTNIDGSVPTNAEVLEGWIGNATAFQRATPSTPFHCIKQTPLLPPLVLACTNIDRPAVANKPNQFHEFFDRGSFSSYKKHLVEADSPSALCLSNHYETLVNKSEEEVPEIPYGGHHLLRREIDYLARLMPYMHDRVPVQWVKFEQLIYGLQQQKKVILLYDDLARYIQEHCKLSGPLQVLPVLSHFHDVGVISYFYRHPELCNLVITNPQWLASALSSLITSNPGKWITPEVKNAFSKLGREGVVEKEMLQLAYRCAHMRQRYWNEMVFILNCMDLICCHPSLHSSNSLYVPAMVLQVAPDPYVIPNDNDPCRLYFSTHTAAAIPLAIFNQLVVRSIRSSRYAPEIFFQWTHIQLNSSHHLLLWKEHTSLVCLVQSNVKEFCERCGYKDDSYDDDDDDGDELDEEEFEFSPQCSNVAHLIGEQSEFMPTDNIAKLIETSTNSGVNRKLHLAFSDEEVSLRELCSRVRCFIEKNLQFLCNCWYPGLELELQCQVGEERVTLNQYWKHMTLKTGRAPESVSVWFG